MVTLLQGQNRSHFQKNGYLFRSGPPFMINASDLSKLQQRSDDSINTPSFLQGSNERDKKRDQREKSPSPDIDSDVDIYTAPAPMPKDKEDEGGGAGDGIVSFLLSPPNSGGFSGYSQPSMAAVAPSC